ncbi:hypothetical protein PF005_g65 [Phytophthora fragariae]|uniref:Uncharacterized protein n=1 Tax=Phytophthora fragariae TaxID=53985 RepID=A0A6A3ZPV5_9STRA|nr:hypothetical protein PF003_g6725 [Phytophthora fragariae]KAE8966739.1 hypothetical protein PF011_g27826 [Phytophthora fragariae]KAE9065384.1 hypothetical protein PF010_g28222 [Phytophthora fragariae]KAE9168952.1 hypothetical protein PF004_g28346 [Phytophthora fragariae]KAE9173138.1 hypothetical protein PF002_g29384 [Phytophthora fragariae]
MRHLFHRSDKRLSVDSDDGVELKERRSSLFRRCRPAEDSDLVELVRPRDTLVTRISESESPTERRRRRRRSLL